MGGKPGLRNTFLYTLCHPLGSALRSQHKTLLLMHIEQTGDFTM